MTTRVRHLFAAYDLARDHLFGHVKPSKKRTQFLEFCRYLRTLYPAQVRIAIVCDNYSPHLTTKRCRRVADWAEANNAEIAYTRPAPHGSTASRRSSPPCATSRSTAPTTAATRSRAARSAGTSSGAIATPTTPGYVTSSPGRTLPDAALAVLAIQVAGELVADRFTDWIFEPAAATRCPSGNSA